MTNYNKASEIVKEALDRLESMEQKSLYQSEYVFARGINHSKYILESTYVKILELEDDTNV
jgi:hypothetical protein